MLKKISLLFAVLIIMSLLYSCSDRGITSKTETYPSGLIYNNQHLFSVQLGNSMFESIKQVPLVRFEVYTPDSTISGYGLKGLGAPLPVLYLLSPFKEDEFFYLKHGLQDVADRMIAAKEINPMIIVCVNGSNGYGSSFYGNSEAGGKYAELIGLKTGEAKLGNPMTLIDYVDAAYNTLENRETRAIGGIEIGGYGAMRIAMEYSENFSSVSAISSPLDFNGASGNGGFVPQFLQVINELDTTYHKMDTSAAHPLQSLFFAASTSFSPHDTGMVDGTGGSDGKISDLTTYFHPYFTIEFHLPFDSTGATYEPIWNLWLQNNPENILAKYPTSLDSTAILMMATSDASFGFYQQTVDFHNHLTSQNISHQYLTFGGYPGYSATGHKFVYDLLPKILKFHSDNFVMP
jgi:S-formylglutathione hydrolase FrmB